MMQAAIKRGETVRLAECELPAPRAGQLRIKVDACGVCGTDLHLHPGEEPHDERFGHEMAGTVLEVGHGVTSHAVGDKVAIESSAPCGHCAHCHNGRQELCQRLLSFFHYGQFGFQEETLVPAVTALPYHGISAAVASLAEPLGVAVDLVDLSDIGIDNNVLIIGPGCIGLMALALVKRAGARRVFVSGHKRRRARVEVTRRFGADEFFDPTETPLTEVDFGAPIDRILVTAPPRALPEAFAVAATGAIISYIGIEYGDGAMVNFDANAFHFKKLQLRASFASPALYTPRAVQYLEEGVVDGEALVSHRYPLSEIATALDTARSSPDAIKVVVTP